MSLWNKIVIGTKFVFGGFESATDYILKLLNEFLAGENVAGRVQKAREYVVSVMAFLKKYEKYCPAIWAPHFEKLVAAVQSLVDAFEDGSMTSDELEKIVESVRAAIAEWMK